MNSPVIIICGGYGSGKSEISVNYVLKKRHEFEKVAIVDLDIVNPYFRSREAFKLFEEKDIELVAPKGELRNSALPALPGKIYSVLKNENVMTIVDLGGDDTGAKVLARYHKDIPDNYEMFLVVNPARPYQDSAEKIVKLAKDIEIKSRKKITGIINNSNLLSQTTVKYLEENFEIVKKAAEKLKLPIVFSAISKEFIKLNGKPKIESDIFELDLQLSPSWRK
ncbi:MAG: ATP-binding protein [Clostridia bacterium]